MKSVLLKKMKHTKVEVSAIITKVENNSPEITFFTPDGEMVPQGQEIKKERTEAGTKFFTSSPSK